MITRSREKICEVKDFPKPGINFKDITPLVEDAVCYNYVIDRIAPGLKRENRRLLLELNREDSFLLLLLLINWV